MMHGAWAYPQTRYYYDWYGTAEPSRPDAQIKRELLDRLRTGPYEDQYDLDVTVEKGVVILTGVARSILAKRAAGDDAWDTSGISDVSNQLEVVRSSSSSLV